MFKKYMHIEKLGNEAVRFIEVGECTIFPKLDGTNGSVWIGEDNLIHAGSRTRELSEFKENAGFFLFILSNNDIFNFMWAFRPLRHLRLFGEWLVPHSLKTYTDDAWRKFYVFDVFDDKEGEYLPYHVYKPMLDAYGIDYIPALCTLKNASSKNLLHELQNNNFLIEDGEGIGEGIVIKNYDYKNKFGDTIFAKIVSNQFKEKHQKAMGPIDKKLKALVEQKIVDEFVDEHLVNKTYAKIVNECEGWNSTYIPRLLNTVYYDFIHEEIWDVVKKLKNPIVDFGKLKRLIDIKVKEVKSELF